MIPGLSEGFEILGGTGKTTPVVQGTRTASQSSSGTTSHVVTLPGSIVIGELLIAMVGLGNVTDTTTFPAGWTRFTLSASLGFHAAYRVADGSEGASITVTGGSSNRSAHLAFRISNYTGTPEIGTEATATSTTPDPPSVTPSWGSDTDLIIACYTQAASTAASGAPSGYTNLTSSLVATNPSLVTAEKTITSTTEDPGTFTGAPSAVWRSQTIAIRGA